MADAYTAFKQRKRFTSLDGLRAISIAAIVWHHTAGARRDGLALIEEFRGVEVFLAISGFVITTLLLRERERTGTIDFRRFYRNRMVRTFPLYFTVLGIYIVLVAAMRADELAGREFFANLPYFLTYTSNWFVGARPGTIFSFSWSLATQEQFYATWPMALAMFPSTWAGGGIAVGSALGLLGDTGWISGRLGFILDRLPFTLLLSAALACAAHVRGLFRWLYPIFGQALSTLAIAVLLGVTLQAEGPVLLQKILAALLILSCALRDDHALARILGWRFLTWAGALSYGVYLFHGLVYNTAQQAAVRFGAAALRASFAEFVVVLLATFLLAHLSFTYYESWFLRFKTPSRVERRRTAPAPMAGAPIPGHASLVRARVDQ